MVRVAVLGGGTSGLATALMLGRRGHHVTLFEQDARGAGDDLDRDFHDWHRPRVPQAVQPHGLLAPVRAVLKAEVPDVYEDLLARGAREHHEFDWFPEHPPYRPGDEELVTLRTRRIVLEAALAAAVRREPSVEVRHGAKATGLDFGAEPGRVAGVLAQDAAHPDGRTYPAELVVDACGRRSPVPRWVAGAGCRPPVTERHSTGLVYLCRWYRVPVGASGLPGTLKTGSTADFAFGGVFPSDNGTFAASLVVSLDDPTRTALTDPEVFEAAARRFPAIAGWLELGAVPETGVLVMGGLDNCWTSYVDGAGPVVTGLVNVGDSLVYTNPTLGQGVALGLKAAQWLAGHVEEVAADPAGYHDWTVQALRPWFDKQVAGDGASERLLAEAAAPTDVRAAALAELAFEDPVVMRARAQVRHQVRSRDEAYGADEVQERVTAWLAARPGFTPVNDGPTRTEWEALIPV